MKNQKGIKFLDASFNHLLEIPRFFNQAGTNSRLSLSLEIPRNTFPKLYELESINYSHNNLTQIYRSVFTPLFSIR